MIFIDSESTDPYFNLATEEYLFRKLDEDILYLYINTPSVIVGKHQNAYEEINLRHITGRRIPVVRRISGGGTVYHDEGNLNFTFIRNRQPGTQVSFIEYTTPVVRFLESEGLSPVAGDKNELREQGFKFSGNAEHVFKNRVLHHGTLLFSSEMNSLGDALRRGTGKYTGRAVQSNRTNVGNLQPVMPRYGSVAEFRSALAAFLIREEPLTRKIPASSLPELEIAELMRTKYMTDTWNFGYAPDYRFENSISYLSDSIKIDIEVKRGIITRAGATGNREWERFASKLQGMEHTYDRFRQLARELGSSLSGEDLFSFF